MERTSTNKKKGNENKKRRSNEQQKKNVLRLGFQFVFLICQVHVPNNDAIIKYIDFRVIVLTDGVHCQ